MVVPLNTTEVIYSVFADSTGTGITGASPSITIRRKSDGYYWDFNDSTFKASGWTTRVGTMSEVDATNDAGLYSYSFDTTGLTENTYFIRAELTASASPVQVNELQVGYEAESISIIESDITSVLEDTGTTIPAQISALNNISSADVTAAVPTVEEIQAGLVEKEVMLNTAYDGTDVVFNLWLEAEGQHQTAVTNAQMSVYNEDGTLLFSLNEATPDAQGVFTMRQTTSFTADKTYYAVCQITYDGNDIVSTKGFVTLDLSE